MFNANSADRDLAKPNNLKIAIYLRLLSGGGAERVILNLAEGLAQKGFQIDLVLNTKAGPYLESVPQSIQIVDLNAPRLLSGLPKLVQYLQREKPQILLAALHYTNEVAIWATRLSGTKTKVVVAEHNTLSAQAKHCKTDRFSSLLSRWFYPLAHGVVAVSEAAAIDLAQITQINPHQIRVIYNPVITPRMLAQAKEPPCHPWLEVDNPPLILGIGRLDAQKNFSALIRAFSQVLPKKSARLMILGSGPERAALQNLTQELDITQYVHFAGFVKNPYTYIARASVFVLSSRWEGLPTVLIESLALNTPVISTDCPSGPKEILAQGKYGSLVPLGNTNAMAVTILETLNNLSSTPFSDENIKQHLQKFTLETATEQYTRYFYEILGVSRTQSGQSPKRRNK